MMQSYKRKVVSEGKSIADVPHIVNADGQYLFCKYWEPETPPTALVCLVHGYGAHCARFKPFAEKLNEIGAYVFAHDHIGHGESEGDGWYLNDFKIFVRDVFQHVKLIKEKYPELPVFLFGHSMGGSIAVVAAAEQPEIFRGVIVSGGSMILDPDTASPFKLFLLRNVAKILPRLKLMELTSEFLSRDKAEVEACENDPLQVHQGMITRTAQSLVELSLHSQSVMDQVDCPLLILHGGADRITNVEGSKVLYEKAKTADKTLKIFPELYHNLLHELMEDRLIVMRTITEWIKERFSVARSE